MSVQEKKRLSILSRPLLIFGVVMFVVYLFVGLALLFVPTMLPGLDAQYRVILGIGMIIYAGFRFYRIWRTNSYS